MASGFSVTISASDQASKTIDAVNKRLKAFSAPYEKMQKSFGQFADVSGLSRVGRAFGDIGRTARDAAGGAGRVAEQIGLITGAASIAGVIRMTQAWADWGSKLGFSARMTGMTANGLYQLQNAGRLAGLSAGEVTTAMESLKQAMTDAPAGRNTRAAGFFNQMHLSAQQLKGDATTILPQVADMIGKLMKVNPQLALHPLAALFGGDADLLKLFGDGNAGLQEFLKRAQSLGGITDDQIKKANQLRQSQAALSIATENFGMTLSATLQPVLEPIVDFMTQWLTANKLIIAQDINGYIHDFMMWLKSPAAEKLGTDFHNAYTQIDSVVTKLGGVEATIKDIMALMTLNFALKVLAPFFMLAGYLDTAILKIPRLAAAMRGLGAAGSAADAAGGLAGGAGALAAGGVAATVGTVIGAVIAGGALVALVGYLLPHVTDWLTGHGWAGDQNSAHGNSMAGRGHAAGSGTNAKMRFNAALAQDDVSDFMRMGWTRPQANIIEGNLRQESGLNEGARNRTSGAYGLAQWLGSRASDFQRVEGVPLVNSTRAQQRAFINWELHNTEAGSGALLHTLTNEGQAAQFGRSYERYGPSEEGNRVSYAQQLAAPMQLAAAAPAPGAVGGGDAKMHIVVEATNGAKASVKTASNNVVTRMAPGVAQTDMGWAGAF